MRVVAARRGGRPRLHRDPKRRDPPPDRKRLMDLGLVMFPTDYTIGPVQLATEAERRGFASLWFPEHTHIPVGRRTPWPGGGDLPQEYSHTLDPFVALGAAAAVTERLQLGTGICLVAQHDPIVLAKEVATLDLISGGRFLFGIGVGWNEDEMEHHGVDPSEAPGRRPGEGARDEGAVDAGGGRLRRRVREVRAELVMAEAGAAAPPADLDGRCRRPGDLSAHHRVLRRLDADLGPEQRRRAHRRAARAVRRRGS